MVPFLDFMILFITLQILIKLLYDQLTNNCVYSCEWLCYVEYKDYKEQFVVSFLFMFGISL